MCEKIESAGVEKLRKVIVCVCVHASERNESVRGNRSECA